MAQAEVLIIGGGVIGASIAYYLAEAGTRVTLLERGRAGGHASLASAGLLHPMQSAGIPDALRAFSAFSFDLYPDLVRRLRDLTGIDPEYQACGWLRVALREEAIPDMRVHELPHVATADSYGVRLISGDEARVLEPALTPEVVAAVHYPRGAQVYVPSLLQAYTHAAARLGATVRRGVEVTDLCVADGRVTGARTADGETVDADHTVIAGGAWTPFTAQRLGVSLPIYPMRGQILALHTVPTPFQHIIFGNEIYLAPKADGSVVAGATYEEAGFDDRLTAEGVGWLLTTAPTLLPSLAQATFRQAWVGLRPASRDGLPLLGAVPGWEGITVATGHTAEGVLLSPATGKLMAQHVRGEPAELSLAPFSLGRLTS